MILALTLMQLGAGLLLASLFLHPSEVGDRLLRLLGTISILTLLPWGFTDLVPAAVSLLLWIGTGLALAWWLVLPRAADLVRFPLLISANLLVAAGLIRQTLAYRRPDVLEGLQDGLLAADALTSALLLGSTLGAMLLGHAYLVQSGMSVVPLLRLTGVMGLACVCKVATSATALVLYGWPTSLDGWMLTVLLPPGLFYVVRVLVGVAGPLALTPLVWKTTRMHATQSATGILYAAVVLVLIGELSANFLLTLTRLPF